MPNCFNTVSDLRNMNTATISKPRPLCNSKSGTSVVTKLLETSKSIA